MIDAGVAEPGQGNKLGTFMDACIAFAAYRHAYPQVVNALAKQYPAAAAGDGNSTVKKRKRNRIADPEVITVLRAELVNVQKEVQQMKGEYSYRLGTLVARVTDLEKRQGK